MRPATRCGASLLLHRSNPGSSVDSGITRKIRARVSRPKVSSSWEVSRSGSLNAKLPGRPPASRPHQTLKDFLDLFFSCRCSQIPERAFGQPLDARLIAAEPTTAVPVLLQGSPSTFCGFEPAAERQRRARFFRMHLFGGLRRRRARSLHPRQPRNDQVNGKVRGQATRVERWKHSLSFSTGGWKALQTEPDGLVSLRGPQRKRQRQLSVRISLLP